MKMQKEQTLNIDEQQFNNPISEKFDKNGLTGGKEVLKLIK